ncbi:MAG: DUF1523 family protein [Planktomarina sp.]
MIRALKWSFAAVFIFGVVAFLHYTMPQRDIVRITGTEVVRTDLSGWNQTFYAAPDSGAATAASRDIRFINAVRPDGSVVVYRNEDTGLFSWPPYIKVNSSDLQAKASDVLSTKDNPSWVIVRHYGWRSTWFSIYPNALKISPAKGPDQRLIPWFNIGLLLFFFAVFWAIYVRVKRFWDNRIEPRLEQADARMDEARDSILGRFRK